MWNSYGRFPAVPICNQSSRIRGRGRVEIVEFPSQTNHYRLVFEITDTGEGADNYEIEVDW